MALAWNGRLDRAILKLKGEGASPQEIAKFLKNQMGTDTSAVAVQQRLQTLDPTSAPAAQKTQKLPRIKPIKPAPRVTPTSANPAQPTPTLADQDQDQGQQPEQPQTNTRTSASGKQPDFDENQEEMPRAAKPRGRTRRLAAATGKWAGNKVLDKVVSNTGMAGRVIHRRFRGEGTETGASGKVILRQMGGALKALDEHNKHTQINLTRLQMTLQKGTTSVARQIGSMADKLDNRLDSIIQTLDRKDKSQEPHEKIKEQRDAFRKSPKGWLNRKVKSSVSALPWWVKAIGGLTAAASLAGVVSMLLAGKAQAKTDPNHVPDPKAKPEVEPEKKAEVVTPPGEEEARDKDAEHQAETRAGNIQDLEIKGNELSFKGQVITFEADEFDIKGLLGAKGEGGKAGGGNKAAPPGGGGESGATPSSGPEGDVWGDPAQLKGPGADKPGAGAGRTEKPEDHFKKNDDAPASAAPADPPAPAHTDAPLKMEVKPPYRPELAEANKQAQQHPEGAPPGDPPSSGSDGGGGGDSGGGGSRGSGTSYDSSKQHNYANPSSDMDGYKGWGAMPSSPGEPPAPPESSGPKPESPPGGAAPLPPGVDSFKDRFTGESKDADQSYKDLWTAQPQAKTQPSSGPEGDVWGGPSSPAEPTDLWNNKPSSGPEGDVWGARSNLKKVAPESNAIPKRGETFKPNPTTPSANPFDGMEGESLKPETKLRGAQGFTSDIWGAKGGAMDGAMSRRGLEARWKRMPESQNVRQGERDDSLVGVNPDDPAAFSHGSLEKFDLDAYYQGGHIRAKDNPLAHDAGSVQIDQMLNQINDRVTPARDLDDDGPILFQRQSEQQQMLKLQQDKPMPTSAVPVQSMPSSGREETAMRGDLDDNLSSNHDDHFDDGDFGGLGRARWGAFDTGFA